MYKNRCSVMLHKLKAGTKKCRLFNLKSCSFAKEKVKSYFLVKTIDFCMKMQ